MDGSNPTSENPLLGLWSVVWTRTNGQPKYRERCIYAFSEQAIVIVRDEGACQFVYTIDAATSPALIDWTPAGTFFPWQGIYTLNGNELTLCATMFGMPRPTEATTEVGDMRSLTVLRKLDAAEALRTPAMLNELLVREFGPPNDEPPLERQEFDSTANEEVAQLFYSLVSQDDSADLRTFFQRLTEKQKTLAGILMFIEEVDNGGLYQFFRNTIGNFAGEIVEQLRAIGAEQTLAILRDACSVFPDGQPAIEQAARRTQLEAFTLDQDERLEELTNAFYRRREDLPKLLLRHWQA